MTVQPNTTQFIPSAFRSHSIHGFYLFTGWWFFLCLNQVMLRLRRHQGLVLDHCKNEHRHRYTKTKSAQIPGSLHLQWARGEEYSWSSWRCRSVATDRSSHPVGKLQQYKTSHMISNFNKIVNSFVYLHACSFYGWVPISISNQVLFFSTFMQSYSNICNLNSKFICSLRVLRGNEISDKISEDCFWDLWLIANMGKV